LIRRSKLEIYFNILEVIYEGIHKPTRIMYASNLSWNNLSEILKTLTEKDFIRTETIGRARRYYITEKGKQALHYHQKSLEGLIKVTP